MPAHHHVLYIVPAPTHKPGFDTIVGNVVENKKIILRTKPKITMKMQVGLIESLPKIAAKRRCW